MSCDIGYIIKDHIVPLMQVLTNDLRDYNMQLLTTKCLNTAIVMWYLFLGTPRMKDAAVCDSRATQKRGIQAKKNSATPHDYDVHEHNPLNVIERLKNELLSKELEDGDRGSGDGDGDGDGDSVRRDSKRTIFYVMMTDATLPRADVSPVRIGSQSESEKDQQFFPGHVYVIEKLEEVEDQGSDGSGRGPGRMSRLRYNMFQSYIDEYTLDGHSQNYKSFSFSYERACDLVAGLQHLYSSRRWDARATKFWNDLTHVDCTDLEGYQFSDQSYMCYCAVETNNCVAHLREFLEKKMAALLAEAPMTSSPLQDSNTRSLLRDSALQQAYRGRTDDLHTGLKDVLQSGWLDTVYGDYSFYLSDDASEPKIPPLNNGQMLYELSTLLGKL